VGIAATREGIEAIYSVSIETAPPNDRNSCEPYHVAGGFDGLERVIPPADPAATVARGLTRQRRRTKLALQALLSELSDAGMRPEGGVILAGRGRQSADLARLLASHAQIHIAEGNAVRESLHRGLTSLGLAAAYLERQTFEEQPLVAGMSWRTAEDMLDLLQPINRGTWRKEDKTCALAAWCLLFDDSVTLRNEL